MKPLFFVILLTLFSATSIAQELNHHPSRILITFSENSPVYQEMLNNYGYDLFTKSETLRKLSASSMPLTTKFFEELGLFEMNKLGLISSVIAAKSTNLLSTSITRNRMFSVNLVEEDDLNETIQLLRQRDDIEIAEPDYIMKGAGQEASELFELAMDEPNDPFFSFQWGLQNTGQSIAEVPGTSGEDINIIGGWDITQGTNEITLAVLDSGIPTNTNDFDGRVLEGYDFVSNDADYSDDHGHGTSVTSIALATGNNNTTIAGVDWNASILPIKILDSDNRGFYSWWVNGIYYAIDNDVDVMNMSVGGSDISSSLERAINDAANDGIIIIACMMNENNGITFYPAGYDNVIAVGAFNNKGERANPFSWGGGSNYGDHIELVAPGDRIASINYRNPNEGGSLWSGTSQATPMVSGTVSLMLSLNPDLTLEQVRTVLKETARGNGSWDKFFGWGKLDALAALEAVQEQYPVSNEQSPSSQATSFSLDQNYPNPFNPTTQIGFQLPNSSKVTLQVFDMLGREVMTLLYEEVKSAGTHSITFDASELTSGVYIYRIKAGEFSYTRTMALIK